MCGAHRCDRHEADPALVGGSGWADLHVASLSLRVRISVQAKLASSANVTVTMPYRCAREQQRKTRLPLRP